MEDRKICVRRGKCFSNLSNIKSLTERRKVLFDHRTFGTSSVYLLVRHFICLPVCAAVAPIPSSDPHEIRNNRSAYLVRVLCPWQFISEERL